MQFSEFVEKLPGKKQRAGNGFLAFCPAHNNTDTPALSVSPGLDRILISDKGANCSAEAITGAIGLKLADLYYRPRNGTSQQKSSLSLADFARAKGFSVDFLAQHSVHEDKNVLVFRYLTSDGQKAERQRIRLSLNGDKKFLWTPGKGRPIPYGLWKLSEARKAGVRDLILCEGESDALTFWLHNQIALGIPGADMCSLLAEPHVKGFSAITICSEPDQGGEMFEKGMTARLAELRFGGLVRIVEYGRAEIKDASDLHLKFLGEPGAFESEFGRLVQIGREIKLQFVGAIRQQLSSIIPEKVSWLWDRRLPVGKLILFAGDPGTGKSTTAIDIAARLSRGDEVWPDGRRGWGVPCSTLILSDEDGAADTIRPRAEKLGANLERIEVIKLVRARSRENELIERGFNLTTDIPQLEEALRDNAEIRLVVIDPVSSYMGGTDTHRNADVRTVLSPLAALAERYRVAIILITHLNKGEGSAQHRITGSIAFLAASRAAWLFGPDPKNDDSTLFLPLRMSLAAPQSGLRFHHVADADGEWANLIWDGPTDTSAEDVLAEEALGRKPQQRAQATELLLTFLSSGPQPMRRVEQEAEKRGIALRTLRRAKNDLKVESVRDQSTIKVRWLWQLADDDRESVS